MRLVDADEIKKMFDPKTWQGEMMIAIAETIPTAYNPDKVVEQLEKLQQKYERSEKKDEEDFQIIVECICALNDAIEIVEAGGI